MIVKVLPIVKYPFKNIQNQVVGEFGGQEYVETLLDFDLVYYNYEIDSYIAFNNFAPQTQVAQIGTNNFKYRFSRESLKNVGFLHNINMKEIKFFIFQVQEDYGNSRYYYYYVDDFRIINENLYEYDLTIDVIKTYLPEIILGFENVKPLRYFQPVYDYFNFNRYSNYDIIDPLIPKQTDISSKIKLCHYVVDGEGSHFFTGTWTYFYMKFSSEDDYRTRQQLGYEGQDFYIIAMPKFCGKASAPERLPDEDEVFSQVIYDFLLKSQFLIKAVDSDIPPFNNKLNIVNREWKFVYEEFGSRKTWNIKLLAGYNPDVMFYYPYNDRYIYIRSNIKQPISTDYKFSQGLLNELIQAFDSNDFDVDTLKFLIVRRRNPNNINKDNKLIKYYAGLEQGVQDVEVDVYHPHINYSRSIIQNDTINTHRELNKLFSNYEIGYQNSNKLPIDINLLYDKQSLAFTSFIKHDLLSTEEIITYVDLVNENEIFTKRSSELRRTKIADEFQNYLYQNSNSLAIKEKQLNVWNDVKTIASGTLGIVSGIVAGNTMGVVGTTYSTVTNLFDNEMKRREHKAKMNDMKKMPLAYEAGNFNSDISYLDILPVLIVYRNSKTINYTDENANLDDKQIYELIKFYSFYTPLIERKRFRELFTRRLYNYIQIVDANEIIVREDFNIPNQHLTSIFHILENGVRFWTLKYIENNNQPNPEIT